MPSLLSAPRLSRAFFGPGRAAGLNDATVAQVKLVMTLLARDEADIVAANLDYHLAQGVDFVIATNHSSRDATAELLRGYERRGVLLLREAGAKPTTR